MKTGLYWDGISNAQYHALSETPKNHHFSSSQLKKLLEDPEKFYRLYVSREEETENESKNYFDIGSYFHTALLEPHLIKTDYVVFKGTRAGKMWTAFQEQNPGKTILTTRDHAEAMACVDGVRRSPFCLDLIQHEEARYEVSVFVPLHGVRVKVRFDILALMELGSEEESYGGDLKSMAGSCRDRHTMRTALSERNYRLSAALYIDAVNEWIRITKAPFKPVTQWYWIFASKKHTNAQTVRMTPRDLEIGRAQYTKALTTLGENNKHGWTFEDGPIELSPAQWEVDLWEKAE